MENRRKGGSLPPWFDEITQLNAAFNNTGLQLLHSLVVAVQSNDAAQIPDLVDQLVQIDPGEYWAPKPVLSFWLVDKVSDHFFDELQARLIFLGDYASYRRVFEWWQPKRHSRRSEVAWHESLWSRMSDTAASGKFVLNRRNPIDSRFVILVRTLEAFFRDYQRDVMKRSARKPPMETTFKTLIDAVHLAFQFRIDEISQDMANHKANERRVRDLRKQFTAVARVINRNEAGNNLAALSAFDTSKYKKVGDQHFYVDYFSEVSARKANALLYFYYSDDEFSTDDSREARANDCFEMRKRQIEFFEFFFGAQETGQGVGLDELREAAGKTLKAMSGKQDVNSNEFWISLLPPVFEALFVGLLKKWDDLAKRGADARSPAKDLAAEREAYAPALRANAWTIALSLLRWYFESFAEHSKYDIRDSGTSYLNTPYPASTTGRLLHDCGVYAVRVAYIVGASTFLMGKRTKRYPGTLAVEGSFVLLPFHVGLLLETNGGPACIMNNGDFEFLESDELDRLRERWTLSNDNGTARDTNDKAPLDRTRFWGDLTASKFIDAVDMPFRLAKIPRLTSPTSTLKRSVWLSYLTRVIPTNSQLFASEALKPTGSQFAIANAYLQLLQLKKEWFNKTFVPFWNDEAIPAWQKYGPLLTPLLETVSELQERIEKETDTLADLSGKVSGSEKTRRTGEIARMTRESARLFAVFDRHRRDYLNVLMVGDGEVKRVTRSDDKSALDYLSNKGLEGVRKGEKKLDELRAAVEQYLDANRGAINTTAIRSRHRKVNEVGGRHGEVFAHIKKVAMALPGYTLTAPPFSSLAVRLDPIPE